MTFYTVKGGDSWCGHWHFTQEEAVMCANAVFALAPGDYTLDILSRDERAEGDWDKIATLERGTS